MTPKPSGYWANFENLSRELVEFIDEHGTRGIMPITQELRASGFSQLARAIRDYHGGFETVAEKLGLKFQSSRKPDGYWDDIVNIENELRAFIAKHGVEGVMPTQSELKKFNRSDLARAIGIHDGIPVLASRLGLKRSSTAKPLGYWNDSSHLEDELLLFIKEHGEVGVMPLVA